ncbi:XdhC family protein [Sinomicrobium sp. M5D2P17]
MSLSKEIRQITKAYDLAAEQGKRTALATVVHVEGSSYRRPGARMLITEDGELTGAISGGCLEGDALRKSLLVIMQDYPMLVTYDTSDEDDAVLGVGLGCNGIIRVLIEPLPGSASPNPVEFLKKLQKDRYPAVLVTLFSLEDHRNSIQGTRLLLKEGGSSGELDGTLPQATLLQESMDVLENGHSVFRKYQTEQGEIAAFIQYIPPEITLLIAGAGNDIFPVVEMADILGWEVTLIDGRPNYANKQRFSSCNIVIGEPEKVLDALKTDDRTAVLLMTHNYNYDKILMRRLLQENISYIGMLGPQKKRERILEELRKEGMEIDAVPANVFSPVGLDIGAETSEEIALSAISEIKAVFSGKPGTYLRDNKGSIHESKGTELTDKINVNA